MTRKRGREEKRREKESKTKTMGMGLGVERNTEIKKEKTHYKTTISNGGKTFSTVHYTTAGFNSRIPTK